MAEAGAKSKFVKKAVLLEYLENWVREVNG